MKKKSKRNQGFSALVGAAALTLALSGVADAASPSDAWITTRAKLALMTAEGVGSTSVNVDTVNRQVTLHGTVNSADEKQKAEQAVRTVDGVGNVRNLLQVVSPAKQDDVQRNDQEISEGVTAALGRQESLSDSSIKVQSVNKGVVLLGGSASNMTDHLTAVRTARSVPGVRRVASEVQSSDELADSKTWNDERDGRVRADAREAGAEARAETREAGAEVRAETREARDGVRGAARDTVDATKEVARDTGNAVGNAAGATADAASDLYITSMVKMRLLADGDTPAMDINVDTNDGRVALFGMVPTAEVKAEAEAEAKKVAGVKSVDNELQVVASAKQDRIQAKDEELASSVKQRLSEREQLQGVNVDVKNCVVRLNGTVPSGEERVEAMQVARATRGVCSVQNELDLKRN